MKDLVTAENIVKLHRGGGTLLEISAKNTIVTPEARDVAKKLGVIISDGSDLASGACSAKRSEPVKNSKAASPSKKSDTIKEIRQAIEEKFPSGTYTTDLIEQLVKKAMQELKLDGPDANCERQVSDSGVVLVRGSTVKLGQFDGAPGKSIGLSDVIGTADNSPIAAGFMQWENASFPWTLSYDEIDVVLEGELHIRCDGKNYIGKPGDVFYIPKNTAIEFATPNKVRFVYVTYPADWADNQVPA